jgi:hypothetical protein
MSHFVSVGLPESGKTTYLAALWHVLESREVPGSLQLTALQADREYLNKIRDAWIDFARVPRTLTPAGGISFYLSDETDAAFGNVDFPDLPGESFRAQWTERQWTEDFDRLIRAADGILLFLHPAIVEARGIVDFERAVGSGKGQVKGAVAEVDWDPLRSPTQTQVVELLQFLVDAWQGTPPIPTAILVSAWDRITTLADARGDVPPTPEAWIAARMPLLSQYLRANSDWFKFQVYGVSAQGGDFDTPGDRERMMDQIVTSERIRVVERDAESHDPTSPLRWLLHQTRRS